MLAASFLCLLPRRLLKSKAPQHLAHHRAPVTVNKQKTTKSHPSIILVKTATELPSQNIPGAKMITLKRHMSERKIIVSEKKIGKGSDGSQLKRIMNSWEKDTE